MRDRICGRDRITSWSTPQQQTCTARVADVIIANDVSRADSARLEPTTNKAWIRGRINEELPRMSKTHLADEILNKATQLLA